MSLIFPTNIVRSMFIIILIIRYEHVSWASPSGTILMGGSGSGSLRTSEKIDESGTSSYSFDLEYDTT